MRSSYVCELELIPIYFEGLGIFRYTDFDTCDVP